MVIAPRLLAVSDLHVRYPENRAIVDDLAPGSDGDWRSCASGSRG
jgi:hypothetical protein